MTNYKVALDGTHSVSKGPRDGDWRATVSVDLAALTDDMVGKLALHGLTQKLADAAAGAKTEAEATAAMSKAADAILSGEWTSRKAGDGVSEVTRIERQTIRELFKAKVGGKSPEWAEFTGLSDDAQAERLDAMFAKNEAALRPAVDAKIAALKEERARKAALATDITI